MAIKLEDKPNVTAPNAEYPYGAIRDNDGSNNGTPVNTTVYGDHHQFFARLLALSGITINDLPDNAINGFQYIEALKEFVFRTPSYTGVVGLDNNWVNEGSGTYDTFGYYLDNLGYVNVRGVIKRDTGAGTGNNVAIYTLPGGYRPAKTELFVAQANAPTGYVGAEAIGVSITAAGVITPFVFKAGAGVLTQLDQAGDYLALGNIRFKAA